VSEELDWPEELLEGVGDVIVDVVGIFPQSIINRLQQNTSPDYADLNHSNTDTKFC